MAGAHLPQGARPALGVALTGAVVGWGRHGAVSPGVHAGMHVGVEQQMRAPPTVGFIANDRQRGRALPGMRPSAGGFAMMTGEEQPRRAPPGLPSPARNRGGAAGVAGEERRGRALLDVPTATRGGGEFVSRCAVGSVVVVLVPIGGAVGGDGESIGDADGMWLVAGPTQPVASLLKPGVVPGERGRLLHSARTCCDQGAFLRPQGGVVRLAWGRRPGPGQRGPRRGRPYLGRGDRSHGHQDLGRRPLHHGPLGPGRPAWATGIMSACVTTTWRGKLNLHLLWPSDKACFILESSLRL